ncbi:MAG: hypothetical protein Q9227_008878 [Pyrenula ochraceoflavens]
MFFRNTGAWMELLCKKSQRGCRQRRGAELACTCDESRPKCVNCSTSKLQCSYSVQTEPSPTRRPLQEPPKNATVSSATQPLENEPAKNESQNSHDPSNLHVNLEHLELLHHFSTSIGEWMTHTYAFTRTTSDAMVTAGLSYPFLLHEMLAMASLHFSLIRPHMQTHYKDQAATLHLRAISLFNKAQPQVNAENCVAMFLFTSFIWVHVLFDTVMSHGNDFSAFLEGFLHCLDLYGGIKMVIRESWPLLQETYLRPMLNVARDIEPVGRSGPECQPLHELIDSSGFSESTAEAYKDAISHLQWVFNVNKALEAMKGSRLSFAWPSLIPTKYKELLAQRRPEALLILAYFAVVLHDRRESWFIGTSGRFIIESISSFLGKAWGKWLVWPNMVLTIDSGTTPLGLNYLPPNELST